MIQKIALSEGINFNANKNKNTLPVINKVNTVPDFRGNYTAASLVNSYQAYHGIKTAKTVNFGQSLSSAFNELSGDVFTCRDLSKGMKGEIVGKRFDASDILAKFNDDLPKEYDAIKTNIEISTDKENDTVTEARTQIKKMPEGRLLYEMALRQPRARKDEINTSLPLIQLIQIKQDPFIDEKAYVFETKGNLMTVLKDGNNMLLTNSGNITKKTNDKDRISISVTQKNNSFIPFTPVVQEVEERKQMPSIGEGTEIVIGMEEGRFVPEIIDSINCFIKKINDGDIILKQFVASPEAKDTQLVMLAGGFGSRAEYTNASSDGIFYGKENGAQSTKGVFRTATGLTPMETTFVSLHNAGLLDCSKGKLNVGDNIKFYLNKSGINKGNGGFTIDLYNKMDREGRKSLTLFPNDSMSRMSEATKKMTDIMNSGKAAVVMIAKEVKSDDAKGNFGIMRLGADNEILEFAEKPKVIPQGYETNGKCLTNTFQFSVSKEAFEALSIVEPYLPKIQGKESKDWSGTYIPILMSLTQKDNADEINEYITKAINVKKKPGEDIDEVNIPKEVIEEAKNVLGDKKIIAVPTDEPWADCGSLSALYYTTMQIANNDFPLEDFERKHVLDSINTQTGLITSTPEQKKMIEDKYNISGSVMVVPEAKKVSGKIVEDYIDNGLITVNER